MMASTLTTNRILVTAVISQVMPIICISYWTSCLKDLGPKSGTGRILMVDGEPQTLNAESGPLLDYYTIQAYYCHGDSDLDGRFQKLINKFSIII